MSTEMDPAGPMTLALLIPVWNDAEGLAQLLAQVPELGVFSQVIVVDDASDPPVPQDLADPGCELVVLRLDERHGAGFARNRGLDAVTASHVIFFDSDDLFTPDFRKLVDELRVNPSIHSADFTIFRHVDSRVRERGGLGPLQSDQAYWASAMGAAAAADLEGKPRKLPRAGALQLCRIAAYPWNKIYRTAFLREQNIRCTEIPVHNDLELHWASFLKAKSILCSARVCCEHFVHPNGSRLTNRTGEERLRVFEAFDNLLDILVEAPERLAYMTVLLEFALRLSAWIKGALEPQFHPALRAGMRKFLLGRLTPPLYALIAVRSPDLAMRINDVLRQDTN